MNNQTRYFGSGGAFGTVSLLPAQSWPAFVAQRLEAPARLPITREHFRSLSPEEKKTAKRAPYFTPAAFRSSPSPRIIPEAVSVSLVCLDVDDSEHARLLLAQLLRPTPLLPYAYAVYHTASSTPEAPRLRVVVPADSIAIPAYGRAVAHIAALLSLPSVTPESTVSVQPMFVPTLFLGDELLGYEPLITRVLEAPALCFSDFQGQTHPSVPTRRENLPGGIGPIDNATALAFLSAPLEGFDLESAQRVLKHIDPDCPRDEWIKVLCATQHQFGKTPEALALFDEWSAKGAKYPGSEDVAREWDTRNPHALGRSSFTFRSVLHMARQAGFDLAAADNLKALNSVLDWLKSPHRSAEELWNQALPKIAALPKRGASEDEAVLQALSSALKKRGYSATKVALKKSLSQLTRSEANLFRDPKATPESQLPAWARGLCFVGSAGEFFDRKSRQNRKPHVLDLELSRYFTPEGETQPAEVPSAYLLNKVKIPVVADYLYLPTSPDPYPEHPHTPNSPSRYVNTYKPDFPEADASSAEGAARALTNHLDLLIAEPEYRALLLAWMAYHVQHPGEKIRWAVLLQGAQGCGKTALGAVMSAVLGASNVKSVSGSTVINSSYNEWMEGAQCIVLEEIRVAGHNRTDVMNALKPAITNDTLSVNQKYRDTREVLNIANYLLLTNQHDALAVSDSDRRYFVLESAIQTREQVQALPEGHFKRLFDCIRTNAAGLRHFLENTPIPESFDPQGPAPQTKYLHRLQHVAAAPLQQAIVEVLRDGDPLVAETFVSVSALRNTLEAQGGLGRGVEDTRICVVLAELGYHRLGRVMHLGTRHSVWIKGDTQHDARTLLLEKIEEREILGIS